MNINIKFWIKKYGVKAGAFLLGVYLTTTLEAPIKVLNQALGSKLGPFLSESIGLIGGLLSFKIPVYSLLSAYVLVWFAYKIYNHFVLKTRDLKIVEAKYGSGNTFVDITDRLNKAVEDNKLKIVLSNNIVGDPTPGVVKKGIVKYKYGNNVQKEEYKENETIELPKQT